MRRVQLPKGVVDKLIMTMSGDLRHRRDNGPPATEHPHLTALWSELEFLAQFARFLLVYLNARSEGNGGRIIVELEENMQTSDLETLSDRMIGIHRALTTRNPQTIPDENLRKLIQHSRLMSTEPLQTPKVEP